MEGENLRLWTNAKGKTIRMCITCVNHRGRVMSRAKYGYEPRKDRPHPPMHQSVKRKIYKVVWNKQRPGWNVRVSGEVDSWHKMKTDAYKLARLLARDMAPSTLELYSKEGELLNTYTYGLMREKCQQGHAFTKENTLVYFNKTDKRWNRLCRECSNKRLRIAWRRRKGQGKTVEKYRHEREESYGI